LRVCLFDRGGVDLRKLLREGRAGELEDVFRAALEAKTTWERGAIESLSSDMFRIGG
jgi:molybdenum cofactor biosynthesis enzyme MoaA